MNTKRTTMLRTLLSILIMLPLALSAEPALAQEAPDALVKRVAEDVFQVTGRNPKIDTALALEKVALSDEYFIKRKLYPNVDFYTGLIYQSMGFPVTMFPVLFAIPS